ncbi:hypothetical protein [Diaminobutyricimonas sp. LJ205]|uniref:hypothetical protein n=1 Tax=Diaminobutyricimonas sp. LJ205 TaxID=2683590 RepID=UPI0012F50701|nr:hypothetical protein [Diaminobutyricimonas sp. LJ205]
MAETTHPAQHPMVVRGFDRLLTAQRPTVLAHIRRVRRQHPNASPEEIIQVLERHYLNVVTASGAGVGAAAIFPGVGTGVSLALTGVETAAFLETSALFAQSVTEIHGIAVTDPDRARTMVMAMMLGPSGADLLRNLSTQVTGRGGSLPLFWGDVIGRSMPQAFVGQVADRMKTIFLRRFAARTTASAFGRMVPMGIGAVIGGTANNVLGRRVISSARLAFGPPPARFPEDLGPTNYRERERERRFRMPLRRQLPKEPADQNPGQPTSTDDTVSDDDRRMSV